jgi:hypothetical protein
MPPNTYHNHQVSENTRIVIHSQRSFYLQRLDRSCDGVRPTHLTKSWRVWEIAIGVKAFPTCTWIACTPTMRAAKEAIKSYCLITKGA